MHQLQSTAPLPKCPGPPLPTTTHRVLSPLSTASSGLSLQTLGPGNLREAISQSSKLWQGPHAAEKISQQVPFCDGHGVQGCGLVQCPQKVKVKGRRHRNRRGTPASVYKTGTFQETQRSRRQGAWKVCLFPIGSLCAQLPSWPKRKPGFYSSWHL